MNKIFEAAQEYAARGWHLFPLHSVVDGQCTCGVLNCSDAGKHPRVERGLKEASTDPVKIEAWFGDNAPPSNIGLVTGEISGITVIDIDIGDGKKGAESWAEAIEGHGEPQTLIAQTGS
jgi:putative DNA primase/helicase